MENDRALNHLYATILISFFLIIFLIDMVAPAGLDIGVFYIIPSGAAVFLLKQKTFRFWPIWISAILLLIDPRILQPMSSSTTIEIINKLMTILVITVGFLLLANYLKLSKKAEDLERKFVLAMDGAPYSMIMVNSMGQIALINQQTEKEFGYRKKEILNQPIDILIPSRLKDQYGKYIDKFLQAPNPCTIGVDGELFAIGKEGNEFPVEIGLMPIQGPEGKYVIGSIINISERKKMEELRDFFNEKLERKIKNKITEIQKREQSLLQTQKINAIDRLAAGVAHDYNNKLAAIMMTCSLSKKKLELGQSPLEQINNILKISQKAAGLTEQLLAFGRKKVLNPKIYNINDLILKSNDLLRPLIREDIEFKFELSPDIKPIKIDSIQFGQILMNLVVNARDAMPNGGHLLVKTDQCLLSEDRAKEKNVLPGQYVYISVKDTGIGMDEDTQSKIFEPFYSTKGPDKGTGLGLSTVHGIVQQSDGFIEVTSKKNEFFNIKIYFPCVYEEQDKDTSNSLKSQRIIGDKNILLVEDEESVRESTKKALESYQCNVTTAINGEDALKKLGLNKTINLVITDLIMPRMDGKELAIQLNKHYPNIPIIFLSGHGSDNLNQDLPFKNELFIMKKPIDVEELIFYINKI